MQKYFLILAISLFLFACGGETAKEETTGFKLSVTIPDAETDTAFLKSYTDGEMKTLDSVTVDSSGVFVFEGEVEAPALRYLVIGKQRLEVFVENSELIITADSLKNLKDAEITGSKTQDEFKMYKAESEEFKVRMDTLYSKYRAASQAQDEKAIEALNAEYETIMDEKTAFVKEYVKKNPSSFVSPYIVRNELVYSLDYKELEEVVSSMDTALSKSELYQFLSNRVETLSKVAVGNDFVDFAQADSLGNDFSLSELKGNVILVDFWASWCGPCRRANPGVVEIYKEYHDKGFEILGVSFDESREKWLKAIEKDGLTWYHVSDLKGWKNAAGKMYGVMSIPHTVLIDKNGKIAAKNLSKEELKEKVAELVAQ